MYRDKSIAVVVPAYNEEKLIQQTIEQMPSWVDAIVVIDDASKDRTAEIVKALADSNSKIILIENEKNLGVGGAILNGYREVLKRGWDIAVVMAGDAQMDPEDLPALLEPLVDGRADYTKGNRLFTGDAWRIIPKVRYLGNSVLSLMTKMASGYWNVADSQCGYTAITQDTLSRLRLERIYPRYGMPNDLLIELNIMNSRVVDVPVKPIYNIGEQSGISLPVVIPTIKFILIRGFLRRMIGKYVIRDFHPLVFFYLLGLTTFPVGLVFGCWLMIKRVLVGPIATTSALFAVFLFVTGLQCLFFAMWMDMENNKRP